MTRWATPQASSLQSFVSRLVDDQAQNATATEYRLRWRDNVWPTAAFFGGLSVLVVIYTFLVQPGTWIPAIVTILLAVAISLLVAARNRTFFVRVGPEGVSAPNHHLISWSTILAAEDVERRSGISTYRSFEIRYRAGKDNERILYVPHSLDDLEGFQKAVEAGIETHRLSPPEGPIPPGP